MRARSLICIALGAICLVGVFYFWGSRDRAVVQKTDAPPLASTVSPRAHRVAITNPITVAAATAPGFLTGSSQSSKISPTNQLAHRLTNTTKTIGQLLRDDHAVLLENALIDTSKPLGLSIPDHLRSQGDPGSYIVQSRGVVDNAFRAALTTAGATMVAYIPNNAYLVRASAEAANQLSADPRIQVLPYEPVYKLKSELLGLALDQLPLAPGTKLNVMAFADARSELVAEFKRRGMTVLGESSSPFGPVFTVQPRVDEVWTDLAGLAAVEVMEVAAPRHAANDLSRPRVSVATDSRTPNNYLGLTGTNVLVNLNDSGVSTNHPDLAGRVFPEFPFLGTDDNGHGTFVAGIIAGDGTESLTVADARGSINPGTNFQYRGKAPAARLYVQSADFSDQSLQEGAAITNALISNNSWNYNANIYGIAASSYDAAVRDALPGVTGSQPVLFVFSAGNAGTTGPANDSGEGGNPESILSPGTAKNVITVGATELPRDITNVVTRITGSTTNVSTPWKGMTSSGSEVAGFSSRGNVGIGVEGEFGRFKPDVVAPGTFVVSTRSTTWDERAYYNPTSHIVDATSFVDQIIPTNSFINRFVSLPLNAVGFNIWLVPNQDSPFPFPNFPIFVRIGDIPVLPSNYNFVTTNVVAVPPDGGGVGANVGQNWYYTIVNTTTQEVSFDIITDIVVTNALGNYFEVLSNLNNSISGTNSGQQYYRYESGTSMSAGEVSGTLALMQEFFEQRLAPLHLTNSPALMKALLINGARSLGNPYSYQVQNSINYQGWGLIKLANSIPGSLTNNVGGLNSVSNSMFFFDQTPTNALATGQSQTRLISLNEDGQTLPLRITLVWTDPPGNPAAGVKLVNDLDLIVTNLDTGETFFGNDILAGRTVTSPWDTNGPPNIDLVNNVENVYLASPSGAPLGSNYAITVFARRVNVNAVYAQTNDVVQDYALVISSGNGEVPDALHLESVLPVNFVNASRYPEVTVMTNQFVGNPTVGGGILLGQLVGANTPLLGTTNGMTNQWHFYVITNDVGFTNAAFVTFLPPTLSLPREGVFADNLREATRVQADIDLYVSQDFNLTNLSPSAIAAADKSRTRAGTEFVAYTNSTMGSVYYIGVKSEDQMASQYAFFAGFSLLPFSSTDGDGNLVVNGFPLPSVIPDGTPANPGSSLVLGLALQNSLIRRVIVTNSLYHENLGDIVTTLSHDQQFTVLANHRGEPAGQYTYVYEDNDEEPANLAYRHPDGPGKLRDFVGEQATGVWLLSTVDSSNNKTGVVNGLTILISPSDTSGGTTNLVHGRSFFYEFVDVPVGATNLEVCVNIVSANPTPMELYLRYETFPTRTAYDHFRIINPPGACFNLTTADLPPLRPGRYYIGVYNPSLSDQSVTIKATVTLDPRGVVPINWGGTGNDALLDDAITNFSTFVTNNARIAQVEVGLRIDHPRVSDLAVTLISPRGTRVLLVQNRGGTTTSGFGSSLIVTNVYPTTRAGDENASTNVINTGATVGTLTIDYNFHCVPDYMHVYYEGALVFNSGLVNNGCPDGPAQSVTVSYGPGSSTELTIIMNEAGNTNTPTAWEYSAYSISDLSSYLTFTENTNLTTTPIKFTAPPFLPPPPGPAIPISDFEWPPTTNGTYFGPTIGTPDGWSVLTTDPVTVVSNPPPANTGAQSLSLRSGQLLRTVPTTPGRSYALNFAQRRVSNCFVYTNFNSTAGMVLLGDAVATGGALRLTAAVESQIGSAWYATKQPTTAGFDTTFRFKIDQLGNLPGTPPGADGFTFSIQNVGTNQTVPGWAETNNLSIFFNTFKNWPGCTDYSVCDISDNSIQIVSNGLFIAQVDLTPLGIQLDNGSNHTSQITYANERLSVWLDGVPVMFGLLLPHLMPGADLNGESWVGFTSTTGWAWENHYILDWSFCTPDPVGAQVFVPGQVTNSFLGTSNWQTSGLLFRAVANNTPVGLAPVVIDGHYYQFVRTNISWQDAVATAATLSTNGLISHLATITSAAENEYIRATFATSQASEFAWIGGREPIANGLWRWMVGPEANLPFSTNATPVPPFNYANWGGVEPNNSKANEDYLMFNLGTTFGGVTNGQWADAGPVPSGSDPVVGYLVEFEAYPAHQSGVMVDTFTLTEAPAPLYALAEESLDILRGENAFGLWQLEIWDSRTGQTNNVSLVDWQLQFVFITNSPTARALPPCGPFTTQIPPGQIFYYTVDAPVPATFATNWLFNASGPLSFYFNQTVPPGYGGTNVGDVVFTNNATDCARITSVNPLAYPPPPLLPGQRYYLAIENKSAVNVSYTLQVCFDLSAIPPSITLSNGVAYCATNLTPLGIDYYLYTVSSNAVRAQFEINNPSGDMTLLLRRSLPPTFAVFDYFSANLFTNDELITVFDFTSPVPLTPGDWYLGAANLSAGPVTYCIKATEWSVYGTNVVITNWSLGTNSFCLTWTSLPGVHYVVEGVTNLTTTNWVAVSPTLTATDYATTYCVPLPSPYQFFRVREGIALSPYIPPPVITRIDDVLNGFLISWSGPANAQYQVQWTPTLVTPPPLTWNTFTNPPAVTSVTGLFQFLDNGSETGGFGPMRYYRLLLLP